VWTCQQGLSTIFSSFKCTQCSNAYLFLIIPIAIAGHGIVLVLLLFVLNLTVTDGTINGLVLYANTIILNIPVFFAKLDGLTPIYTLISLANLDLGIQICFYNGMDDYAKMWLQLAFSSYLIFIATLIIITSVTLLQYRDSLHVEPYQYLLHSSYCPILRSYVLCPVSCSSTLQSLIYPVHREKTKTCLTNHKGSISHHIMPLDINSLGGRHTQIQTLQTKAISRNHSCRPLRCMPSLILLIIV